MKIIITEKEKVTKGEILWGILVIFCSVTSPTLLLLHQCEQLVNHPKLSAIIICIMMTIGIFNIILFAIKANTYFNQN